MNTSDCNDTSSVVSVTRTQYLDNDGDTYTNGSSSFCASSSTWGNSACNTAGTNYSKNSASSCILINASAQTDCYDSNASAKPGQTSYFTQARGDGSFDYDCDGGTETKEFPNAGTWGNSCGISCAVDCTQATSNGQPGWSGTVPACGADGNFMDNACFNAGGTCGFSDCDYLSGNTIARTQKCR